jgi:branched-chain amino acid transport system ATP-binding protein
MQPRLLLLDEPMAGLGHLESQQMIGMLRDISKEAAILLVEHDMEAVFALADRISVLVYGRIIAQGSVEEIRNDPAVREAYLGAEDELC